MYKQFRAQKLLKILDKSRRNSVPDWAWVGNSANIIGIQAILLENMYLENYRDTVRRVLRIPDPRTTSDELDVSSPSFARAKQRMDQIDRLINYCIEEKYLVPSPRYLGKFEIGEPGYDFLEPMSFTETVLSKYPSLVKVVLTILATLPIGALIGWILNANFG
ncbi:MAG TPA: hypothetical protein VEA92_01480 [Candidatus Paceibacterota bacterium]|nr:hypothetical protein [Candidatus Paceibacterota bacterium]